MNAAPLNTGPLSTGPLSTGLNAGPLSTAPARPAELRQRRVRLVREPAAAGQARSHLRAALRAWRVPVDPDIAILLASDVVTNVITHGAGPSVTVAMRCTRDHLRVDVYDSARSLPEGPLGPVRPLGPPAPLAADAPGDADAGPELALLALLADGWGVFRNPAGRAVYFTLAFDARGA